MKLLLQAKKKVDLLEFLRNLSADAMRLHHEVAQLSTSDDSFVGVFWGSLKVINPKAEWAIDADNANMMFVQIGEKNANNA